jgi:carboxyl-terminal processing protease
MKQKKTLIFSVGLIGLLLITCWSTGLFSKSERDFYAAVGRNLKIFGQVYKQTANNYVEEIDPEKFMRAGINGMLDELDPYSVFLEQEAQDDIEIMTQGKYYGVGMRISKRNSWPTVAEQPFPNSPSEKAGIREGDMIIEIDGASTKSLSLSKTAARLRGREKGSTVTIKIRRVGVDQPMTFTLVRDEIEVSDIQYSGFTQPGVGLIKLNVFNRGADKQVSNAVEELMDRGMESLILDLRGNPGGLLDVAVSLAGIFVPKGDLVVYTEGRTPNSSKEYRIMENTPYPSLPLVILVDKYSASASEIVAGAIQDLDRGVIIGEPTFGKGLVQTVMPIERSSEGEVSLKLTTAKYYLPSGRLIQKNNVFNHGRNSVFWGADSSDASIDEDEQDSDDAAADTTVEKIPTMPVKKYKTSNGREVAGGGGVTPDVESDNPNTTRYVAELLRQSMFFNFSLEYAVKHPELANKVEISDELLNDFFKFAESKDFDYEPAGMSQLNELEKIAKKEGFDSEIAASLQQVREQYKIVKKNEREKSIPDIKYLLKRELTAKLQGTDAAYATSFERDETLKKAIEIIKDRQRYNAILAVSTNKQ